MNQDLLVLSGLFFILGGALLVKARGRAASDRSLTLGLGAFYLLLALGSAAAGLKWISRVHYTAYTGVIILGIGVYNFLIWRRQYRPKDR